MADTLPAALIDSLRARLGDRARPGEPLARYTSFRIGGPADLLVLPDTATELAHVLATAAAFGARVTLLGGGSNVLVGDGGMRGVVVKLGRGFTRIEWEAERGSAHFGRRGLGASEERSAARAARAPDGPPDKLDAGSLPIRAGAAVALGRLARAAAARGLAGLEYAEGIPGTVGGALFMNAGAYGGELAHTVECVEGLGRDGAALELPGRALVFGYRRSALPPGFVVTAVRLRLRRDERARVRDRMDAARARRIAAQPHGKANAGSIFKNPNGDHAGRLIEVAGLKGARAGRARISERHANFIVNEGGARAADVKALMDVAQRVVWERSGVWLEPEVQLVGSW
ncbi:MAG TPA: UDP-N-acetylmuramate dehydrogenase [Verrucomicrobiae bacterium]|nr:UDP-N-acetylmuramate dehydrogenase [Verrucomicrobiae bacterium]